VKFLEHEPDRLTQNEIFTLAAALGRYVKSRDEG
jgi:hypothetical protein